jgi:hypothetical protein
MSEQLQQLLERIDTLEARLTAAEDVLAIQNLKSRYGQLADARYTRGGIVDAPALERIADELAGLFSEDAVWDGGGNLGLCEGRNAIRQRFLEPTLAYTWHYFVKPRIDVDGDRARGTWDVLAHCTTKDGRAMWMSGSEDDDYVKQDGVWLHQRMKLSLNFMAPYDKGWS